jgi:hypothetical protein
MPLDWCECHWGDRINSKEELMTLKQKLNKMIKQYGKPITHQILLEQIESLNIQMRKTLNIYHGIDIEHEILDRQSMIQWLKEEKITTKNVHINEK